jgi:DNA adenine methylase
MNTTTHYENVVRIPIPYFGSKRLIAPKVWEMFGNVDRFVDPFMGGASVLLNRPHTLKKTQTEIVNDIDGHLVNFYRAIKYAPDELAERTKTIRSAVDVVAYSRMLQRSQDTIAAMCDDIRFYDIDLALAYLYVVTLRIGSTHIYHKPVVIHTGDNKGIFALSFDERIAYLRWLSERLTNVIIPCMDWKQLLDSKVGIGIAGIGNGWGNSIGLFLDPPYQFNLRTSGLYRHENNVSADVRKYALQHGDNPHFRIAVCGYEGEHDQLGREGWHAHIWKGKKGYGTKRPEIIWFSPYCITNQPTLFSL